MIEVSTFWAVTIIQARLFTAKWKVKLSYYKKLCFWSSKDRKSLS